MKKLIVTIFVFITMTFSADCMEEYLYYFNVHYKSFDLDRKYECFICHDNSVAALNGYGLDFASELKNNKPDYKLLPLYFQKIESNDSDVDGKNNIDEIKAGTNPGIKEQDLKAEPYDVLFTGNLNYPRYLHSSVALKDGRVLVTGGATTHIKVLETAELYDPKTKTYQLLKSKMSVPRWMHVAALLNDGNVLITGGSDGDSVKNKVTNSVDIFDPKTNEFISSAPMLEARENHTATKLNDGRVLICGGSDRGCLNNSNALKSAEIYDPKTGKFEKTSDLIIARQYHRATLLADGRVLISGGSHFDTYNAMSTCEIFNPKTNKFSMVQGWMSSKRIVHVSVLLKDGRVLLCGGLNPGVYNSVLTADIFDPTDNSVKRISDMKVPRIDIQGVLMDNGEVVIAGGSVRGPSFLRSVEVYNPDRNEFYLTSNLLENVDNFSPVKLKDGSILVIGGVSSLIKFLAASQMITREKITRSTKEINPKVVASVQKGAVPLDVKFDVQCNELTDALAYMWDFGDSSYSYEKNPSHIYYDEGKHEVILTVVDKNGEPHYGRCQISTSGQTEEISYSKEIQPILDRYCIGCHGSRGDLSLLSYENLMIGGKSAKSPGETGGNLSKANADILLESINGVGKRMPPRFMELPPNYIFKIKKWVEQGAKNN